MFPEQAKIIAQARETNNGKADWCAQKVVNAILRWRLDNPGKKPKVALMGLAFKANIDDLRESPACHIADVVLAEAAGDADIMVVEPNVSSHPKYALTDYKTAYAAADIVVMLTAHTPFKDLQWTDDKVILDFCGIWKK